MTDERHDEGCPAREDSCATCAGCPYGKRLAAWVSSRSRTSRCMTCGCAHSIDTGVVGECGLCMRARNENDAVGDVRIVDIRLVRLRDGNWHVSINGELVGEARGPGGALLQVRDWILEGKL